MFILIVPVYNSATVHFKPASNNRWQASLSEYYMWNPRPRLMRATSISCQQADCMPSVPATSWQRYSRPATSPIASMTSDAKTSMETLANCTLSRPKRPSTIRYGLLIARPTTVRNPFHNSSTAHILLYIAWSYRSLSR